MVHDKNSTHYKTLHTTLHYITHTVQPTQMRRGRVVRGEHVLALVAVLDVAQHDGDAVSADSHGGTIRRELHGGNPVVLREWVRVC
jgi:hypothetical protein